MLYLIELQYISERVYVRIWSKLTVYLQPRQDQTFRSSAQLGQKYKVNLEIPTLEILIHNQLSFSRSLLITNIICWLVCSVFFLLQGCHFNWDSILTKYIIWYIHIYSAPTGKKKKKRLLESNFGRFMWWTDCAVTLWDGKEMDGYNILISADSPRWIIMFYIVIILRYDTLSFNNS